MKRKTLVCALGASLALTVSTGAMTAQPQGNQPDPNQPDPNRVLIQFKHGSKGQVQSALKGVGAKVHFEFDAIDAIAATVPAKALDGLRHNPNVVLIERDVPKYPTAQTVPYGIDLVQARDVWDANRDDVIDAGAPTGEGIAVCVIDSGINAAHEDFAGVNIIGGFPDGKWSFDHCGHGTHVAGTIAAASNNVGVVGVSPGKVSLFIVKVFGDDAPGNCVWSFTSHLMDAAARCADAGAKVINMSLGGGASRSEEKMFNSLNKRGVLSIAAAGNHGNPANPTDAYLYPAAYDSVVSAAAVNSSKVLAGFSAKNDQTELAAPGVSVLSTYPFVAPPLVSGSDSYDSVPMANTFEGSATAPLVSGGLCGATDPSWAGKVVLCQRGSFSFLLKSQNVYDSGGVAAVIYNNIDGALNGTLGTDLTVIPPIPVTGILKVDGEDLLANHIGDATTVNTAIQLNANGYAVLSGTSMATPHVSGVAALVWSANPSWSNQQIRDALSVTAEDLGTAGYDTSYGWGLVRAKAALDYLESH